jgi:hypothetical protein
MVRFGFSLADLRQLHIDEFFSFHECLLELLEREGLVKEGTVDKLRGADEVSLLRKQVSKLKGK